ncbi:MAG TPA: nuclear transport factor 2 family protein [Solirubrobacterales bacterium]|nr:nuclear transport factor 2 family protein [Solirubrobacterales bacterium]
MSDQNVEIVRRLFRSVEERDLETMFELYDPRVVIREAPSLPYGGEYQGHEGVVEHGLGYLGTWQPVQQPGDEALEPEFAGAGDKVFVRWRQKATAADGTHVDLPAISEYRIRDGKIVSSAMHHFDTGAILQFLARAEAQPDAAPG